MAYKPITYSKELTWEKGDTKPTVAQGVGEGTFGYEVDETQPEGDQVTVYRYLQGDWRKL